METMTVAQIDDESDRLKSELAQLYSQLNSFSPISRLPTETLQRVFIHYARDYHIEDRRDSALTVPLVDVSYVCSRWRTVALDCPQIWANLSVAMSSRWKEESLVRSKNALLKVGVYLRDDQEEALARVLHFVEQVENHVDRFEELSLHLPAKHVDKVLPKLCPHNRHLRNLKISVCDMIMASQLPPVPFNGYTPALLTFELDNFPFPWSLSGSSSLTTLKVHNFSAIFQQDVEKFLAMLIHMRCLTYLYVRKALKGAPSSLSSAGFHDSRKIDLPHLSYLYINEPLSTAIVLLSCTKIPLRTEVRLDCRSGDRPEDYAPLASFLAQRFSTSEGQPALASQTIRSVVIESSYWTRLVFSSAERDCKSSLEERWDCGIPLQVLVDFPGSFDQSTRDHIVKDLYCAVPLTDVQSLHLINPSTSSVDVWMPSLRRLQDLRYLKLSKGDMPDLASSLSFKQGSGDKSPDQVFAPALEELELYDVEIPISPRPGNLQSLFKALATHKQTRGRLSASKCIILDLRTRFARELDMWGSWGKWKKGRFRVDKSIYLDFEGTGLLQGGKFYNEDP